MTKYAIAFTPPMQGLEGEFNTIRLGRTWASKLKAGDAVLLLDGKQSSIIGEAQVTEVLTGKLADMLAHARRNHNQKHAPEGAEARLVEALKKRYGPQKVGDNRWVTVIYLRRDEHE